MRTVVLMALGLAVLGSLGCGSSSASSTESRLLGTWTDSNTGAFIEFLKDGTLQFGDREGSVAGTWSVLSDGRVNIKINRGADSIAATLIDDARLEMEVAGVKGATFRKQ